ncbi:MAG: histidine kinase dimerization/phospho-acceptor domain-containing protein, partial [Rhizomicrobium sp.]
MTAAGLSSYTASHGLPGGPWRWVALGLFFVAVAVAGVVIVMPAASGWLGVGLVAGIGAIAALVLYAIWPRASVAALKARHIAEAATHANVAWVVTNREGAVVHFNDAYRRLVHGPEHETPPPPELALGADSAAAMLYRLSRKASAGQAHEETFEAARGYELLAAVRPLAEGRAAWWFTPRIAARDTPSPAGESPPRDPATQIAGQTAVFRDAPIGVAIAQRDGLLVEANTPFQRFFGGLSDVKGRLLCDLALEPDRAGLAEALAQAASEDGAKFPLHAAGDRLGEMHLRMIADRLVLYLVDISEQQALETKFAQAQKMQAVGQLAGGVAHDFNNLLTVIIGNCEFLLMRHAAGDPSYREINEVHQNALRAATLVGQLLAFSRKQTLQPRVLM